MGKLLDVAVDLRADSPTYGRWISVVLSPDEANQLWIPVGFGHGFCTLESNTVISYRVTNYYSPENDKGVAWDDPDIGVAWPEIADPETLSPKDRRQPRLSELPAYFSMEDK
jgi:dTDP-4-dehydrorhamnose 3,5-epimerase